MNEVVKKELSAIGRWAYGLASAFIGAAAQQFSNMIVAPKEFNFTHAGLVTLGEGMLISGVIAVFLILKQSPLPPLVSSEKTSPAPNP